MRVMGDHFLTIHPLCGGLIAGVLHTVLGPDHLSTIVTLSACQGAEAFWFGVRWAAGHLTGMTLIGLVFTLVNARYGSAGFETYEYYADYAIGLLLVLFGGYFLLNTHRYFDAEWKPAQATCACHAHCHSATTDTESCESESKPLQPRIHGQGAGLRKAGSVLVGFAQGVACPAGLVGMAFLKQYTGSMLGMLLFIGMFFAATTLAMGCMAMGYGILTQRCLSSALLARAIYCTSCFMSLSLGVAWIWLNANGSLEAMFGHGHGHDHGVAHKHPQEASPSGAHLLLLLAAPR